MGADSCPHAILGLFFCVLLNLLSNTGRPNSFLHASCASYVAKKYYFNTTQNSSFISENGKKKKIKVNKKATFSNMKLSAAFHGILSLSKQKKIPQILKRMQFPCSDALSYSHLAEGKLDIVIQCGNKIWDIHPLIPIIRAAGGIVTTWKNEDPKKGGNIVCSVNKSLHNKMLKILKPVSK